MAKGRKLTASQSERFLGSFACGNAHGYSNAGGDDHSPDLAEDDLWSIDIAPADSDSDGGEVAIPNGAWDPRAAVEYPGTVSIPIRGLRRGGGEGTRAGGLTLAFDCSAAAASPGIVHRRGGAGRSAGGGGGGRVAASAPVNVPDWSKIYRVDSAESMPDSDEGAEEEVVPPHEYLARGRRVGATSVFEGVGRTLKGRDLRRVRDAVWSQTGFDG